ncbi:MAG: Omp28 family outer membrane lipoprotein [Bacteroidales bacterium]|nr:Omp28 family outer membrane lipoprotein [Bacteroidales bacterium]
MVKKFSTILSLVVFGVLLASCDIIEEPYMTGPDGNGQTGEVVRKVLLEEFTGHQCPNCPAGAQEAADLKAFFGDQLIIMSIHAGFFARTTAPHFLADYRSPAGNEINNYFGISYNPVGMVNRADFSGSHILTPSAWGGAISQILEQDPQAGIEISLSYETMSRQLNVAIKTTALENIEGPLYLAAFLLEDNIMSPQQTNDPQYPNGIQENYYHMHVLRADINGAWGEELSDDGASTDQVFMKNYSLVLDTGWKETFCSVVAFVYSGTNMEVIQAEEKKLY